MTPRGSQNCVVQNRSFVVSKSPPQQRNVTRRTTISEQKHSCMHSTSASPNCAKSTRSPEEESSSQTTNRHLSSPATYQCMLQLLPQDGGIGCDDTKQVFSRSCSTQYSDPQGVSRTSTHQHEQSRDKHHGHNSNSLVPPLWLPPSWVGWNKMQ